MHHIHSTEVDIRVCIYMSAEVDVVMYIYHVSIYIYVEHRINFADVDVCIYIHVSVCLSAHPSIRLSVCLSVCERESVCVLSI